MEDAHHTTSIEQSESANILPSPAYRPLSPNHGIYCPDDLGVLHAKVQEYYDNPRTPPRDMAPKAGAVSLGSDFDQVDRSRKTLLDWGLDYSQIDIARRWDQCSEDHRREAVQMMFLAECARAAWDSPPSLTPLLREYDQRRPGHDRDRQLNPAWEHRAEYAVNLLLSEMVEQGCSAEEAAPYERATAGGTATMKIVAEHCQAKLEELKQRRERPAPQKKPKRAPKQKLRRSLRIRKLEKRKEVGKS